MLTLASFGDLASFHLERCLGAYPVDFGGACVCLFRDATSVRGVLERQLVVSLWQRWRRRAASAVAGKFGSESSHG